MEHNNRSKLQTKVNKNYKKYSFMISLWLVFSFGSEKFTKHEIRTEKGVRFVIGQKLNINGVNNV